MEEVSWLLGLAEGLDSETSRLRGYLNLLKFYREYPYFSMSRKIGIKLAVSNYRYLR